uniref:hypothetical protein n=1 Tax=Fulvivirga sp. TaxID=1931237 RepID=UPI004049E508
MKTKIPKSQNPKINLLISTLIMLFVAFSCREFETIESQQLESSDLELSDVEYTEKYLTQLGAYAALISKDEKIRSLVYSQVEKKFDGEYNVLLEDVVNLSPTNPTLRVSEKSVSDFEAKLKKALDAFKSKEGVDYYPQIYIPYYEEVKARNEKKTQFESPMIVLFLGDDNKTEFPGYELNEKDELIKSKLIIDEEFAKKNEVWVISINERYFGNEINKVDNTGITNGRTNSNPSGYVDFIKCKCHYESWAAGASEVNIITVATDINMSPSSVNYNYYNKGPNEGAEIYKFSRSEVSNQTNKDVDFNIWTNWNVYIPNSPYWSYVIFEYDAFPTGKKTAEWTQNGGFVNVEYRSADSFYDKQTVLNTSLNSRFVNTSCLEWSGQYK